MLTIRTWRLNSDNATNIMFIGMIKGLFTGKSLANYFNQTTEDWVNARKNHQRPR